MWIERVVLEGTYVRLEPLAARHVEPLWKVGSDPAIWRHMPFQPTHLDAFRGLLRHSEEAAAAGTGLAFAQVDRASGRPVGSTGYWNADPAHSRVEIGFTWLAPDVQRSPLNREAKLLLLTHAFETLGAIRVEFKTDALNEKSRLALARIGAVEEGTLRHHMKMPGGRLRDSVYFSILAPQWPATKVRLEAMVAGADLPHSNRLVRHEADLRVPPEAAFAALVTPGAIRAWWGAARAVVVPRVGGTWAAAWGADEDAPDIVTTARIAEYRPPHRLVLSDYEVIAKTGPQPFRAAFTVTFQIAALGAGSRLTVTQDGFPFDPVADAFLAGCEAGWRASLEAFSRFVESGAPATGR